MAKLYFRYSTMASGKSLDLLKTAYNYEEREKKVVLITSRMDDRFGKGFISSRVGTPFKREAETFSKTTDLYQLVQDKYKDVSCVFVDESQFLTKKQVWQLTDIVDEMHCDVIAYGLRSDFRGEPFIGSTYLMTLSDDIQELKTVCTYGDRATMNMRIQEGCPIFDGDTVLIGGNDSYIPVCREYYKKMRNLHS
jgi:thymidine kinase